MKNVSWSYYTNHEDVTTIRVDVNQSNVREFINALCIGNSFYDIVNEDGTKCVNARSILGVLYAIDEFKDMFLVNLTHDGDFPYEVRKFETNEIRY